MVTRYMSNDGHCLSELGKIYYEKFIDKIEHEGTEISQDADNADQKVKWFLKVDKTYKLLWEAYF